MERLDPTTLFYLARIEATPLVSLYMPTHVKGNETKEGPIRFKNLLKQAEKLLKDNKIPSSWISHFSNQLKMMTLTPKYWQYMDLGLAIFYSEKELFSFKLPFSCSEHVVVSNSLYLKPLTPYFDLAQPFYLLLISKDLVKLIKISNIFQSEINLQNCPKSLDELLQYDIREKHIQFHTQTPRVHAHNKSNPRRSALSLGQSDGEREMHVELTLYLKHIADAVDLALKDLTDPLILATDPATAGIFRQMTSYPHLLQEFIHGCPKEDDIMEIAKQAQVIVDQYLLEKKDNILEEAIAAHPNMGLRQDTFDIQTILPAARQGRIQTLYLNSLMTQWGRYNAENNQVDLHSQQKEDDVDLLDLAMRLTLQTNGQIFSLSPRFIQGEIPLAAVYRY